MKIIVTGFKGQLGFDVYHKLLENGYDDVLGIDSNDLDITNENNVRIFMEQEKPSILIHCAAYTAVDQAEDNKELCFNVNVNGTKHLVDAAKKYQFKFVYISTDYVFSGEKLSEYNIDDIPKPLSVYGKSKYEGELETLTYEKHFIIRTSWVFGKNGNNFVKTMLKLSQEKDSLSVVSDQMGSPTYTQDLSKLIVDIIKTEKYGIYHATNEGNCSWYEFAKEIFKLSKINISLKPITSFEYKTKATRPINSRLNKDSLVENNFQLMPPWQDALIRYLKEIEVL
jgi:dTDP-4-dehydrorhamnose reductase